MFSYNITTKIYIYKKGVDFMNNNDISALLNMINNMDKNKLSQSINQLNHMLSDEDKKRIIDALNNQNRH